MKHQHFKNIVHEAVDRFGVMHINGEGNEINHQKIDEWLNRNYPAEDTFTVDEVKKYLLTCDSLGDALYFLNRLRERITEEELNLD
jgi:hypothetical protein